MGTELRSPEHRGSREKVSGCVDMREQTGLRQVQEEGAGMVDLEQVRVDLQPGWWRGGVSRCLKASPF